MGEPWRSGIENSLLTPLNLYFLDELIQRIGRLGIQGDIVECGVYKGARQATDEFLAAEGLDLEPVAIDPTASFFQKPGDGFSGLPVAGHYPGWPGAVA